MMLTFAEMQRFTDDYELVYNRVAIINQILGSGFQQFCTLRYGRGRYVCNFLDAEVCSFGVYDVPGVRDAFLVLDSLHNAVWQLSRTGLITQHSA